MENSLNVFEKAIEYAIKVHHGTTRKFNKVPFIIHPLEAASIVATMTTDLDVLAATILHDTVADTCSTVDEIEKIFGKKVASLVCLSSENKRKDLPAHDTWVIRKQETLDFLKTTDNLEIKMICLADKVANLRSCYQMYLELGDKMWDVFNQHDSKMHKWYHENVANSLIELKDTLAYKEYVSLINKIFN